MEPGRLVFYLVAFVTHAFVGYALVRAFTDADPRLGLVFGLLPDADFLFPAAFEWPFVHRGLTHSPLVWLGVVLAAFVASDRRIASRVALATSTASDRSIANAVGLAYGSHLLLDSLSPKGIEWLFPLRSRWSPGLAIHSVDASVLLWVGCLVLLAWRTPVLDPYLPSVLETDAVADR